MTNNEILHNLRARIPADVFVVVEARLKQLDEAKNALVLCNAEMRGHVNPKSLAFRAIDRVLRREALTEEDISGENDLVKPCRTAD